MEQKEIRLASIEDRDKFLVIKDQDGTKYSFFKTKRDGSATQMYNQFQFGNHNEAFELGDSALISFESETKTSSYGKPITYHNIIGFLPSSAPGKVVQATTQSIPKTSVTEEQKWDRIGKLKALHNLAGRRLSAGATTVEVLEEIPAYMDIAMQIENIVDNPPSGDINVDGIPF